MFIKNSLKRDIKLILPTETGRKEWANWNRFDCAEFNRYNKTEQMIIFFKYHLGIRDRKKISKRTGISIYAIKKFSKSMSIPESFISVGSSI